MANEPSTQPTVIGADIACPACGYDLRGISSDKCPECGLEVDRSARSGPHLTWEQRRHIGLWRAYWLTNVRVIRNPGLLVRALGASIDQRAAKSFLHITVLIGWLPPAVWFVAVVATSAEMARFGQAGMLGWILEAACIASLAFALLFAMWRAAGSSYLWYGPKATPAERENASIVGCYSCAPLAWTWIPFGLVALGELVEQAHPTGPLALLPTALLRLAAFAVLGVLAAWVWCVFMLSRAAIKSERVPSILLIVFIPMYWIGQVYWSFLLPLGVLHLSILIMSLS